jgi:hypothetical protein
MFWTADDELLHPEISPTQTAVLGDVVYRKTSMKRTTLLLALLSSACGSTAGATHTKEEPTNVTSRRVITPAESNESTPGRETSPAPATPADLSAIIGLLGARHIWDLPDAETLNGYETGEESLRWAAAHGDSMVLRVRALSLLRHFSTVSARDFAVAQFETESPELLAAAVTALGGQDLESDELAREAVVSALRVEDVGVALAAISVLSSFVAGREALDRACEDDEVPERTRVAVMEFRAAQAP